MSTPNLDTELPKLRIDRSKRRRRGPRVGRIVAPLLVLGAGFFAYAFYAKSHAALPVRTVGLRVEEPGDDPAMAVLTAGGYVIPRNRVEVSSKMVGRVKDIFVDAGDSVKAGDTLLQLEDQEQSAQLEVAQAQLATAQARLSELRAGSRPEEIAAAKAAEASAQATVEGAKLDWDRLQQLSRQSVVSQQELDRARIAYDVAQANLKSAKENASLVEQGPRKEQIQAAEAAVRQAEASVSYATTQLSYTVIHAPIGGTILEKVAEKGELVTNTNFGGTRGAKSSVVTMADLRDLQVEIDINESDLPKVHMGQKCEVRLDSAPDQVIQGEVDEMSPQADRQKGTVQVKVRLIDPGPDVRVEVNARVTFLGEPSAPAPTSGPAAPRIWIPREALRSGRNGPMVYVVADGFAHARAVATGAENELEAEATDGLTGNEQVIVEPLDRVRDGERIVVKN